jgi:hypothetical protein
MIPLAAAIVTGFTEILNKFKVDATKAAEMANDIQKLALEMEKQAMESQSEINLEEAKNPSLFVSGWRPAIGWVCVAGYAINFVVAPVAGYLGYGAPELDLSELTPMLIALLGLGAYRTVERVKGVHRS